MSKKEPSPKADALRAQREQQIREYEESLAKRKKVRAIRKGRPK